MTNLEKWRLYLRDIESPDIYIDWAFYHLISSALQRRVWLYSDGETKLPGSHSLFPNMYIILVGPPATGKGRVIVQEASIIKSGKLLVPNKEGKLGPLLPYSPDKITLEALTQHIAQCIRSVSRSNDKGVKQTYSYSACTFLIEELDVLFAEKTNDMVAVITSLYDSHDMHYKTKRNGEDDIKNVCVSMVAGTTPNSVRRLMANEIIRCGLTSRTVMIFADAPRFYRQFPGIDAEQQAAYNDLIVHVKNLTNIWGEVVMSPEAAKLHKTLYESGIIHNKRVNKDTRLDDYYGRKNIHWLKMMMILHYADQFQSNVIQPETVEKAFAVLTGAEARMHEAFQTTGRNVLFETSLQIIRFLEDKGPTTHNKLWWRFSVDLTKDQFEECLDLLVQTCKVKNSGGVLEAVKQPKEEEKG